MHDKKLATDAQLAVMENMIQAAGRADGLYTSIQQSRGSLGSWVYLCMLVALLQARATPQRPDV